jgi:hypothetical protein
VAYTIVWPGSLPQAANEDYTESGGVGVLTTPMDMGASKVRYRHMTPEILDVSYDMTDAQVVTFRTFVRDTIKGVKRFGIPHPRTGVMAEARMQGKEGGKHYDIVHKGYDLKTVSFTLEILP